MTLMVIGGECFVPDPRKEVSRFTMNRRSGSSTCRWPEERMIHSCTMRSINSDIVTDKWSRGGRPWGTNAKE